MTKDEVKQLTDDLNKRFDDLNELTEKKADADKLVKMQDDFRKDLSRLADEHKSDKEYAEKMQEHLDELEGKIADAVAKKDKSLSVDDQWDAFFESDSFNNFKTEKSKMGQFDLKADTITSSNSFTEANSKIIPSQRDPLIGIDPRRPVMLMNMFRQGVVGKSDYVDWVERTAETTGTKNTAEGAVFGDSDIEWTSYKIPVEKISDYIVVAREKLEDTDFIRSEVMDVLQYNIPHKVDTDLFDGDGTNNVMYGLLGGGSYNAAKTLSALPSRVDAVTGANIIDALRVAALKVQLGNTSNSKATGFVPTAHIINPVDLFNVLSLKESTNESALKMRGVTIDTNGMIRIFGVPVLTSQRIDAGSFLTGDFNQGKLYTRRGINIQLWDQNSNDPIYDQVTFTATWRGCLVIKNVNTYAFATGTFANVKSLLSTGS